MERGNRHSNLVFVDKHCKVKFFLFTMATTKRKHTEVTLQIKYQALQELEKGRTCKDVTAKFNVPGPPFPPGKRTKRKSSKRLQRLMMMTKKNPQHLFPVHPEMKWMRLWKSYPSYACLLRIQKWIRW